MVQARYTEAAAQRSPRVDVWDRAYDAFNPYYIDESKVKDDPKVKFPYLFRVVSQQRTVLMESMDANNRWMVANGLTQQNREHGKVVTQFLENTYRAKSYTEHESNRKAIKRHAQMGLLYGDSWLLAEWVRDAVKFQSLDPYDVYPDGGRGQFYIVRRIVSLAHLRS